MTLVDAFLATCAKYPNKIAISFENTSLTFNELNNKANAVVNILKNRGIEWGDRVGICLPNSLEVVISYLGALKAGAIIVPISTSYTTRDIKNILTDTGAKCLISHNTVENNLIFSHTDLPKTPNPAVNPTMEHGAMIFYTSGTTGSAKGALLKHKHIMANLTALKDAWNLSSDDHLLLSLPLHHIHGFGVGLCGSWLAGYSITLHEKFNPLNVLKELKNCTLFMGVPTMYTRLLDVVENYDLSNMRLFISGSAPLSPQTFNAFENKFGHKILERAGMSETMMNFSNPLNGERKLGSVGKALPGVEFKITNNEFKETNGPGQLLLKGPNVFEGYWNNPEQNKISFNEGWFITGDIAEEDDEGYVYFRGRAKDMIISGGLNIYPQDIEQVLNRHPSVVESAVVGIPDNYWGESVKAYVVANLPVTEEELLNYAATKIASYKKPKMITFIDALPRNAMGKIQKHRLR